MIELVFARAEQSQSRTNALHISPSIDQFIFPKAKMGHFDLLAEMGFRCYRGPESKWFESLPGELVRAGMRLLDELKQAFDLIIFDMKTPEIAGIGGRSD